MIFLWLAGEGDYETEVTIVLQPGKVKQNKPAILCGISNSSLYSSQP